MFILVLLALGVYGITVFANGSTTGINVSGKLDITENGIYDISDKEYVDVNIKKPEGTLLLTTNGLYDIENYKFVDLNVNTEVIVDVDELPYFDKGVVPNSGYVDKVYFNTDLSYEILLEYFTKLSYIETPFTSAPLCILLVNEDLTKCIAISQEFTGYHFSLVLTNLVTNENNFIGHYGGEILGGDYSFFNLPEESGSALGPDNYISIESNVLSEYSGLSIGNQNEIISDLFYVEREDVDFDTSVIYRCNNKYYIFNNYNWVEIYTSLDEFTDSYLFNLGYFDSIIENSINVVEFNKLWSSEDPYLLVSMNDKQCYFGLEKKYTSIDNGDDVDYLIFNFDGHLIQVKKYVTNVVETSYIKPTLDFYYSSVTVRTTHSFTEHTSGYYVKRFDVPTGYNMKPGNYSINIYYNSGSIIEFNKVILGTCHAAEGNGILIFSLYFPEIPQEDFSFSYSVSFADHSELDNINDFKK